MIFGAHFYLENRLINRARRKRSMEQTHGRQNTELIRCNISEIRSVELHIGTEKSWEMRNRWPQRQKLVINGRTELCQN